MTIELWSLVQPTASLSIGRTARRLEDAGWDGMLIPDSQNVAADPLVSMTVAAMSTSTLRIGTGVTNPMTRHPAVLAGAFATIAGISDGRAVLGIGRGDSALAHLGQAPAATAQFEHYVRQVRRYLRREDVAFADIDRYRYEGARPVTAIGLHSAPDSSKLRWLPRDFAPPPVEVAASGPRTIAFGAAEADGVLLSVGADPERLRWAVDLAWSSGAPRITAFINVVSHPDLAVARRLGRTMMAAFARFSVMDGQVRTPMDEASQRELVTLHQAYDMRKHGGGAAADSAHAGALSDEFIDRFGIVGDPSHCISRLKQVIELGVDRIVIVSPTTAGDRATVSEARTIFARQVLPAIRVL